MNIGNMNRNKKFISRLKSGAFRIGIIHFILLESCATLNFH